MMKRLLALALLPLAFIPGLASADMLVDGVKQVALCHLEAADSASENEKLSAEAIAERAADSCSLAYRPYLKAVEFLELSIGSNSEEAARAVSEAKASLQKQMREATLKRVAQNRGK